MNEKNENEEFYDCVDSSNNSNINLITFEDKTPEIMNTKTIKGHFRRLCEEHPDYDKLDLKCIKCASKYCSKCKKTYSYPNEYFSHMIKKNSNTTEFRCCDNLNISEDKMSKADLIKYVKYLKKQNFKALLDIHKFYENKFTTDIHTGKGSERWINYKNQQDLRVSHLKLTVSNFKNVEIEKDRKNELLKEFITSKEDLDFLLQKHTEQQLLIDNLKEQNKFLLMQNEALKTGFKLHIEYTTDFNKNLDKSLTDLKIAQSEKLKVRHDRHKEKINKKEEKTPDIVSTTPEPKKEEKTPKTEKELVENFITNHAPPPPKPKPKFKIKKEEKTPDPVSTTPELPNLNDALGITELKRKEVEAYRKRIIKLKQERDMKKKMTTPIAQIAEPEKKKKEKGYYKSMGLTGESFTDLDNVLHKIEINPIKKPEPDPKPASAMLEADQEWKTKYRAILTDYDEQSRFKNLVKYSHSIICKECNGEKIVYLRDDEEEIGEWWLKTINRGFGDVEVLHIKILPHNGYTHKFKEYNFYSDKTDFIYKDEEYEGKDDSEICNQILIVSVGEIEVEEF